MNDDYGFRLYAKPSFLEGVARLVDIGGMLDEYNTSKTAEEADYRALESDWEAIGQDIQMALDLFHKEHREQLAQ